MMSAHLELPKGLLQILVSFESLYGTCCDTPSVRAVITLPKFVSDLFIFFAFESVPLARLAHFLRSGEIDEIVFLTLWIQCQHCAELP